MLKSPFTLKNLILQELEAKRKASVEVEAPAEPQQPVAAASQPEEAKTQPMAT